MQYVEKSEPFATAKEAADYLGSLKSKPGFQFGYVDGTQVVAIYLSRETKQLASHQKEVALVYADPPKREYQEDIRALGLIIWPHP